MTTDTKKTPGQVWLCTKDAADVLGTDTQTLGMLANFKDFPETRLHSGSRYFEVHSAQQWSELRRKLGRGRNAKAFTVNREVLAKKPRLVFPA